jgi:AcrR family transcriptional regulator
MSMDQASSAPTSPTPTKERILVSTAELFRRQGYTGTGMKQIAAEAGAPFGSVYHFFPGGKTELAVETVKTSGRMYMALFAEVARQAGDVESTVNDFFVGAARTLEETGYEDACPIATVALEVASTNEELRIATAGVFEEWLAGASAYFAQWGIAEPRARELSLAMLSLLEGAFIFSRAMRDPQPVLVAGESALALVREALAEARTEGEAQTPAEARAKAQAS